KIVGGFARIRDSFPLQFLNKAGSEELFEHGVNSCAMVGEEADDLALSSNGTLVVDDTDPVRTQTPKWRQFSFQLFDVSLALRQSFDTAPKFPARFRGE